MTLLGFVLPPEAGEKITLQITVLLSICFFLSVCILNIRHPQTLGRHLQTLSILEHAYLTKRKEMPSWFTLT